MRNPITVEHEKLLKWRHRKVSFEKFRRRDHDPKVRARARKFWTRMAEAEHRSVTIFSDLLPQLIDARAPLPFQTVVMRLSLDELRHAELCARLAIIMSDVAPPLSTPTAAQRLPLHAGCGPAERALRNVVFACCLSETFATATLARQHEGARDPVARAVLAELRGDETLHARFGWLYLEQVAPSLKPDDRRRLGEYVRFALGQMAEQIVEPRRGARRLDDESRVLGLNDPVEYVELFHETVEHAILPGLARFGVVVPN